MSRDLPAESSTRSRLDADAVLADVGRLAPRLYRKEHAAVTAAARRVGRADVHRGDRAVFVRLMSRPRGDTELARTTVERTLDLVTGWDDLNEFKHTSIPR